MKKYMEDACEEIDAALFSGDFLHTDADREELKQYLGRWQRAVEEHERLYPNGSPELDSDA